MLGVSVAIAVGISIVSYRSGETARIARQQQDLTQEIVRLNGACSPRSRTPKPASAASFSRDKNVTWIPTMTLSLRFHRSLIASGQWLRTAPIRPPAWE
jgi:hypothetical protein